MVDMSLAEGVELDAQFRRLLQDTFDGGAAARRCVDEHGWLWDWLDKTFDFCASRYGDGSMYDIMTEVNDAKRYCDAHAIHPPPLYAYVFSVSRGFLCANKIWSHGPSRCAMWKERFPEELHVTVASDDEDDDVFSDTIVPRPPQLVAWLAETKTI